MATAKKKTTPRPEVGNRVRAPSARTQRKIGGGAGKKP